MRFYLLLFLLFLFVFESFGQRSNSSFKVLKYRGEIMNYTTQQALKKKSRYLKTDSIVFKKSTGRLAVENQRKNLFIVRPNKQLKPIYVPIPYNTRGRDGVITSSINLVKHLNEKTKYLVAGDECKITISPRFFRMTEDSFFFIRYYWQGEGIDKRLPFRDNQIIISKSDLYQARFYPEDKYGKDTTIIIPAEEVSRHEFHCYGEQSGKVFFDPSQPDHLQNRSSVPFQLHFLDDAVLLEEASFFLNNIFEEDKDNQLERFQAYLEERFEGEIEEENLKEWLNVYGFSLN